MIFNGNRIGVTMFPGGTIQWFTNPAEAKTVEESEVAKFAAVDAERERVRLARLGLKEVARTYSVTLPEQQPGRKHPRRLY